MRFSTFIKASNKLLVSIGVGLILIAVLLHSMLAGHADILRNRELKISTSEVSASALYRFSFSINTPGTLGSVMLEICSNDPRPGNTCIAPSGLDASAAALTAQAGPGDFVVKPNPENNKILLSRTPSSIAPTGLSFTFTPVTNPSSPGSYFVRLLTYATDDGTGPLTHDGGIAFAILNAMSVTATVPPYLIFCTGIRIPGLNCANTDGDYIDFGELSPIRTSSGTSQMIAATNAQDGYNITVSGTTMASGNNVITALAVNDVSRPGTSQFGLNLHNNSTPAVGQNPTGPGVAMPLSPYFQANSYRFVSGEAIVTHSVPDDIREYTASYIVNVPKGQAPGIYVTTLTYICLATF